MNGAATNKSRTRVLIVVDCISRAQTLRPALMKIPDGANNRITIKTIIPTASLYAVEIKTPENVSMRPNAIPPTMALVKLPRPPSVAATPASGTEKTPHVNEKITKNKKQKQPASSNAPSAPATTPATTNV